MRTMIKSAGGLLLTALTVLLSVSLNASEGEGEGSSPDCQNANVISGKLITDICWDCLYPIVVSGVKTGGGTAPSDYVNTPMCLCEDNLGAPRPGVTSGMWEPARLVEFQRTPGCSSVLNGVKFPFDRTNQGHHSNGEHDGSDISFMHYHYYSFPVLQMMDMFVKKNCIADSYTDLDVMYLSELDPTWNNDEIAFFANPEAAAVANPVATLACIADVAASAAKKPLSSMFWCAGSWGTIYPLSGRQTGGKGMVSDSSLLSVRVLASLHRRGLEWKTSGPQAMCKAEIHPTLPKAQYKFTMLHPVPETKSGHMIGESTLTWGLGRHIPAIGEDPIYTVWRWRDCCNSK